MTLDLWEIPSDIMKDGHVYFNSSILEEAIKLVRLSRVSISFIKDSDHYYVVSGIVKTDRSYETKIVYRERLIGTPEGPLSSNCDCYQWSEKNHCLHAACLFLNYRLKKYHNDNPELRQNDHNSPPIPSLSNFGVNVLEYGTLLAGPHALEGSPPNSTYSSLQYLLHGSNVVNFPIPGPFKGKLLIAISSSEIQSSETIFCENIPGIKYQYQDQDNNITDKISLFEHLYLFRWDTGEAFHIPRDLKSLLQKIRIGHAYMDVNELIQITTDLFIHKICEIIIDDKPLSELKRVPVSGRITLNPGIRKNQIELSIFFYDADENIMTPPQILTAFTFVGGMLATFRKKEYSYDFIKTLFPTLEDQNDDYRKSLICSSQKERWIRLVSHIKNNQHTYIYNTSSASLCQYSNEFLKTLLTSLYKCFSEMMFRFSEYNEATKQTAFQIQTTTLFQGLTKFHKAVTKLGMSIYYDRTEISSWNSRMKFERKIGQTNWFNLELNVDTEDLQVIKNVDLKNGLALTKNGLVLLSEDQKELLRFIAKYTKHENKDNTVEENPEGPINKFIIPFNKARIFELFELKRLGIHGALTPEENELCNRLLTLEKIPVYTLPPALENIIRPYQRTGFHWLRFLYENHLGACLADDMGLGKTLQSIAFLKSIHHEIKKVLVICPVTLLLNWSKEIEKFSDMESYIYHGDERNFPDNVKIILTSYGVMKKEFNGIFQKMHFDVLILDEVQQLKNIRSLGAYAARKIDARFRICLTGTPVENDLAEFYNIIDLSIPGIWGDLQFVRAISTKESRLKARKMAGPFLLRRTKGQVLKELPPKIEHTVFLDFTEEERSSYTKNLVQIRHHIEMASSKRKYGEILKGLLRLRQNCLWQKSGNDNYLSTKIDFLIEQLKQILAEGHQVIIFSQFTTYLDIIQNTIIKRGWHFSRIDGTQTIKKREQQVELFQNNKTEIFLISLKAGGVGLNLTAASYVFVMDPWWNPAVETQAVDRAHRIGQKNRLTVYRPIIKNSVEEKVLDLQEMKRQLFYDLLPENDETIFSGKLTMKDFVQLFNE